MTIIKKSDRKYLSFFNEDGTIRTLIGNRDVDPANVKKIRESMRTTNALTATPIVISKSGEIVDGQHRYVAATELGLDLHVVYVPDRDAATIMIALNGTNGRSWPLPQYAKFWAEKAEDAQTRYLYRTWLDISSDYKMISPAVLIGLFEYSPINSVGNTDFKQGKLALGKDLEFVYDCTAYIRELSEITWYTHIEESVLKKQTFQRAVISCLMDYTFRRDKFLRNLQKKNMFHRFNELSRVTQMRDEIARITAA